MINQKEDIKKEHINMRHEHETLKGGHQTRDTKMRHEQETMNGDIKRRH